MNARLIGIIDAQLGPHAWRRIEHSTDRVVWTEPRPDGRVIGMTTTSVWMHDRGTSVVMLTTGAPLDPCDVLTTLYVWNALPAPHSLYLQQTLLGGGHG